MRYCLALFLTLLALTSAAVEVPTRATFASAPRLPMDDSLLNNLRSTPTDAYGRI